MADEDYEPVGIADDEDEDRKRYPAPMPMGHDPNYGPPAPAKDMPAPEYAAPESTGPDSGFKAALAKSVQPTPPLPSTGGDLGYAPVEPKIAGSERPPMQFGGEGSMPVPQAPRAPLAPPQYQAPKPMSLSQKILGHIASGLAGYGNAEAGLRTSDAIFEGPTQRAQQQFQLEQNAYEKNKGLDIEQEKADQAANTVRLFDPQTQSYINVSPKIYADLQKGREANTTKENVSGAGNQTKEDIADKDNKTKEDIEASKETAAVQLQKGRPRTMDQLAAQAQQEGDQKTVDAVEKFKKDIAAAGKQEPGSYMAVPDADGNTVGWVNPKSREFVAAGSIAGGAATAAAGGGNVLPMKPSGQTASRMQQGDTVIRAGDNLINDIKANKAKLGNVEALMESAVLNTPWADPETAQLRAEIGSFIALNPAMHGFRGASAMQEFSKLVGGIPNNPDALIAAIQGIQKTAKAFHATGSPSTASSNVTGPKKFSDWKSQ